ncbi:MAG: 3-oxoacyl-[acyl-carrier-protein] reductase [Desulfobacterales bacterium]
MRFENKVVMVTGGAAGIGRVTAENFAKEGAKVAICDVNTEAGEAAVKELGPEASFAQVDVANSASVSDWVEAVMDQHGQIDVLVNNAGITRDGLIMRMKEEDWDAVISVNLKSAFNCIKAVSKIMVKQRSGRIINLASVVGVMGNPGQANYVASKAGMIGLTKTVAKELGSRGITVNAVAPGFIETDMTAVLSEKAREAMLSIIPLQRAGTAQDVAEAITFLASDSAAYITGQVLHVTGGMYM